jgi:hypothetical protein
MWCLSTPPRHDRCARQVVNLTARKVGQTLDTVGATVPVYDGPVMAACPCECQRQEALFTLPQQEGPPF